MFDDRDARVRAVHRFIALALFSSGPGADHLLFAQDRKEDGGRITQVMSCEHANSAEKKPSLLKPAEKFF